MERGLYNLGIKAYRGLIHLAAFRSEKARKWVSGRKNWRISLEKGIDQSKKRLLVHAASLGELEQGLPVLKSLRSSYPNHQIVLSFFSPSGFEFFKEDDYCDLKIYLPLDTPQDASDFAAILKPELSLFIKYEIWPNLIRSLKKQGSKLVLAPAHFRSGQIYFKSFAQNWLGASLKIFDAILVQNQESYKLLKEHGIKNVSICGDSRFDRALENRKVAFEEAGLEEFIGNQTCLIAGSSWPKEEALCLDLLYTDQRIKLILAPHEVNPKNISRLMLLFSKANPSRLSDDKIAATSRILIVDSIGQLKFLYRFADIALIGGGFGKGVHSTVEAAVYQIPLLFGPNHSKFPETAEMLNLGLAKKINSESTFKLSFNKLLSIARQDEFKLNYAHFLDSKKGASGNILSTIQNILGDG